MEHSAWLRVSARSRAEWPLVEAITRIVVEGGVITQARIALGGVANRPIRAEQSEAALVGQAPSEESFSAAAALASDGVSPLPNTAWRVPLIEQCVQDCLQSMGGVS